jgi:fructokinase
MFGGIEAGGTKFVCGIGTSPHDLEVVSFPTVLPDECLRECIQFFRHKAGNRLSALGIASFGPIDLDAQSSTYGYITTSPKFAWRNFNFAGAMASALAVPVAFDTDVNAAALAEAKWGAAQGLDNSAYVTVGTGIGAGVVVRGHAIHGLMHPEIGHISVPHDWKEDPFPGNCSFHGDCLEGLASGPAIFERWGTAPETLPATHPAWKLEAKYLAAALSALVYILSPQRIVMGGGIMQQETLLPLVRQGVTQLVHGYIAKRQLDGEIDHYIVRPQLGGHSGVLGAILIAKTKVINGNPHDEFAP